MQEERVRQQEQLVQQDQQAPQGGAQQQAPVDTRTPAVQNMAQAMASQMQSILQAQTIPKVTKIDITQAEFLEQMEAKRQERFQQQQLEMAGATAEPEQIENILIPSGTIEYGQLLIEANTDAPGPVLAQVLSGPLRGARLIGSFQSTENYLTLDFNSVIIDGLDYPAEAIAIDPETTLPGIVTDIDRKYFKRVVLPAAAEFISGLADAISESGRTTITITGDTVAESENDRSNDQEVASGISEAGDRLSEILDEEADATEPMLKIAAGTPIGILFVGPVVEPSQN
jgi:intracellular multiplication protein IcmE